MRYGWVFRVAIIALLVVGIVGRTDRASAGGPDIEQRIADFWNRINAMQPSDYLSSADLGQWALNVIERDSRARTTIADFRASTADMQAAMERAGRAAAPTTSVPTSPNIEQRIADFWNRVNALQPSDHLSSADLGQWALNVIERDSRARITVADFRASTADMQAAIERAGRAAAPAATAPPTRAPAARPITASAHSLIVSASDLGLPNMTQDKDEASGRPPADGWRRAYSSRNVGRFYYLDLYVVVFSVTTSTAPAIPTWPCDFTFSNATQTVAKRAQPTVNVGDASTACLYSFPQDNAHPWAEFVAADRNAVVIAAAEAQTGSNEAIAALLADLQGFAQRQLQKIDAMSPR